MNTSALQLNFPLTEEKASTRDDYVNVYNLASTFGGTWYYYFSPMEVNPLYQFEEREMLRLPIRLTDPLFGRDLLNKDLEEVSAGAPAMERIWEITKKVPLLSKLLSDERNHNE